MIVAARKRADRARDLELQSRGACKRVESWDIDTSSAGERDAFSMLLALEDIALGRPASSPDPRWHMSVAGRDHVPSWELMVECAHRFRPGVMFCVPMPPRQFWLNTHEHCLHLWQIRDHLLEEQWRGNPNRRPPT